MTRYYEYIVPSINFLCKTNDVNGFLVASENQISQRLKSGLSVYTVKNTDGQFDYITDTAKRAMKYEDAIVSFECTKNNQLQQKILYKDLDYVVEITNLTFIDNGYLRAIGRRTESYKNEVVSIEHSHIACEKLD